MEEVRVCCSTVWALGATGTPHSAGVASAGSRLLTEVVFVPWPSSLCGKG